MWFSPISLIRFYFVFVFSVLHFVHWLWKYRDCQSVWFSWTPRRAADNRTCKKVQVLGLSCVQASRIPQFIHRYLTKLDCSPMNVILNASDICLPLNVLLWLSYCVVTRGSPFFIIWFMGKSCVCIKSRLALMEPSWLKPSRGILTLVRNCWNSSSPKLVFQETGRTPFPQ